MSVTLAAKNFHKLLEKAISNRWTGLWTGLLDWITGSNQTASKGDDACLAHGIASKAEVQHCYYKL